jgi:hypothetical protein
MKTLGGSSFKSIPQSSAAYQQKRPAAKSTLNYQQPDASSLLHRITGHVPEQFTTSSWSCTATAKLVVSGQIHVAL